MRSALITVFFDRLNMQSIKYRIVVSLLSNIVRSGLNFITIIIIARCLTTTGYGDLMFLLGSFVAFRSVMDLGASTAFYTFISQGNNRSSHYFIYFLWLSIQFLLLGLFIQIVCPASMLDFLWVGHSKYLVLLAFMAAFFQEQGWQTINQIGESERKTILSQLLGFIIALVNLAGITFLYFGNSLTVTNILIFYIIEYIVMIIIGFFALDAHKYLFCHSVRVEEIREIIPHYIKYCSPLVMITVVGFFYSYIDTWILQYFGGASQQGLFQISNRFAAISMIVTGSVLNIFWKEIAVAYEQKDTNKVERIYTKAMRGLILFGAVISGFLVPWTNQIIQVFLGDSYINAQPILATMLFYPIHQSMGQLTGAFFLATNQTRVYSITSIILMLVSIPLTYFFQAPNTGLFIPGLGLGAWGLALKIVIVNFVSVNIGVYIISRLHHWKYDYLHQFYAIALTSILGYVSYWCGNIIISGVFDFSTSIILLFQLVVAAIIYISSFLFIIFYLPSLTGFSDVEINGFLHRTIASVKSMSR